ncbi:OLC1v1023871C1 [Oldenlandia corymbosa var. corymbosa]|uniref:OLC1v1023871C1 n=1 Tax=Oldenlandia corymbosa var. corymbosa TaxID=529605 RepID=A0AAV1C0Y1_OLDCO|nr:OLC1v1023871C1 [Oldenlandia corymbosa var. corymbosa]
MVIVAGVAAARSICRSTPLRQAAASLASKSKSSASPFRLPSSTRSSHRIFRRPVELSAMLASMQPYHTATASSLMISNLTVSRCGYGWLFEDM